MRTRKAPRPNATLLCRHIAADMAKKLPELAHVKAARVLFVSGEARRGSRATIKPLTSTRVLLKGKRALYCITLRPKFFRASTPEQRVETLVHELLHISAEFDGRLHAGRRYRLRLRNASDDVHPLHLHRHSFELTRIAGRATGGVIKDVVMLGGYQEIEIDFTADNPGRTLFHCHHQLRRDFGFMALFDYV